MPRVVGLLVVMALFAGPARAGDDATRPGVKWEPDVAAAFERAAREGRAVFIAVNAIEQESANNLLATELYPSKEWGDATRGFVCLVANGNDHSGPDGLCTRYGGIPCSAHRAALAWVSPRFGPELISPQHLLIEPDGGTAWRKEYFSGDVTPEMLESLLSRVTPRNAIRRASVAREARIRELEKAPVAQVGAMAEGWLHAGDGLAAAGVCALLDWCDAPRRLALAKALAATPPGQLAVLVEASEPVVLAPDEDADLAKAWIDTLTAVDGETGARAAARAAVRRARTTFRPPNSAPSSEPRELPDLATLLGKESPPPGTLREVLLAASPDVVRKNRAKVEGWLSRGPERVRLAAALALLGAHVGDAAGVAETIAVALDDTVEGPETREEAAKRLGSDPGGDPDAWIAAIRAAGGGR